MVARCTNPRHVNFKAYGGRGITVCAEWRDFGAFIAAMGSRPSPQHTLERINNNGHYEPGNVRWATRAEQSRNTRRTRLVAFNGETLCIQDWAQRLGIDHHTLRYRLSRWPIERALSTPGQRHGAAEAAR